MNDELKQAYTQLEEAINTIVKHEIKSNVMVSDFVVATALVGYDEKGQMVDDVHPLLPMQGEMTPRYRVTGLLKELIVRFDAVAYAGMAEQMEDGDENE